MKNYFIIITIAILLIFLLNLLPAKTETVNNQPTPNILKKYDTIQICIKLKPYKGKKFLHEDGKIYTAIEDLSKVLKFEYSYDKENKILTINGNKYDYEYLLKNEKILYVGLTSCCLFLGYKVNYDPATNILDISTSGVTSSTETVSSVSSSQNITNNQKKPGKNSDEDILVTRYLSAAEWGDIKDIETYYLSKVDVNVRDENGNNALHRISGTYSDKQKKGIEFLIAHGVNINVKNNDGQTPLHRAAFANCVEAAELLLSKGAEVNAVDNQGMTPLDWAKNEEMQKLLIRYGGKTVKPLYK